MTHARKYINNLCSFWWIVIWSTFSEWTFPGPQKPLPCASQATRSSLGEGGGVLPCWIEEICGIVALTPSTHCSQWSRAWPQLCRVDLRRGNSSGHLCKRVGWGPMCLCGWAIGRGPGSTPPPPVPHTLPTQEGRAVSIQQKRPLKWKLLIFSFLFFGSKKKILITGKMSDSKIWGDGRPSFPFLWLFGIWVWLVLLFLENALLFLFFLALPPFLPHSKTHLERLIGLVILWRQSLGIFFNVAVRLTCVCIYNNNQG